jgi:glycosyltransferase involved in cell wall biosynthesis
MIDLTIIIPTFNRPDLLDRALGSIFIGNTNNIQVIVVDDCESCSGFQITQKYPANYYAKKILIEGYPVAEILHSSWL